MPPVLPLMKKPARLCLAAGTLFALFLTPLAQGRTWTNLQGKKLEAEFIRLDGQKAVLKRSGGQTVSIPLSQLSREDRDFLAEQVAQERQMPGQFQGGNHQGGTGRIYL